LDHNRTCPRSDVKKYALTGFLFCEVCGRRLSGQSQVMRSGKRISYYLHPYRAHCKAFNSVPMQLETAVFKTIFENTVDEPAFQQAIAESLPDAKFIENLDRKIKEGEKELQRIEKSLGKLVDLALSGTLEKATIRCKETAFLQSRAKIIEELEEHRIKLRSMPDPKQAKEEAEQVRRQLLEHFSSDDHLLKMSFDEKKKLLHWLFDGKDPDGKSYGIYVRKHGLGPAKKVKIDYFLYGRIVGLRTIKGDDINYQAWDEDEEEYKTYIPGRQPFSPS